MSGITESRLAEERKNWRKDHPPGFYARPVKKADNSTNMMIWELGIPGKEGTDWAGGVYKVKLYFPASYPTKPPTCKFEPVIFHPNVFTCGTICLSILNEEQGWRPSITIKQIAEGIQSLLTEVNPHSPANGEANNMYLKRKAEYTRRIKAEAAKHVPDTEES